MRTAVAETSIEAFYSLSPSLDLQPKEIAIMQLFGPDTRLSRQQIAEMAHFPINTVCGRIDSLLAKKALVEEGDRIDPATRKRQKLLRLPIGQMELFAHA